MHTPHAAALASLAWITSSLLLPACHAAADGRDASDVADEPGVDASEDPLADLPPATAAQVRDAAHAAWDDARGWAVLASGETLIVVEPATGRAVVLAEFDGPIGGVAIGFDQLVVGRWPAKAPTTLITYDLTDLAATPSTQLVDAATPLAPPLTLIARDQLLLGGVVGVDLATGASTSAASVPYTFVYDPPQVAVRDGLLYTPSAYPGEVVVVSLAAFPELDEVARLPVDGDWLHAVTLLDDDRALVAGHLGGLAQVTLDVDGGTTAGYQLLDGAKHAYATKLGDTVYVLAAERFEPVGRLLCLDPETLEAKQVALPAPANAGPSEALEATLLGEVAPGVARVLVRGVGIVELSCG